MKQTRDFLLRKVWPLLDNWYVIGLAGWAIVAWNYPLQDILPRYAG